MNEKKEESAPAAKIVFVEPPQSEAGNISRFFANFGTSKADFVWPPIELMSIAGYVRNFGIEPLIFDAGGLKKTSQDIKDFIIEKKPNMVVFSTSTNTIYSDLKLASLIKQISKDIVTVAIGSHIMSLPDEALKLNIDLDVAVYNDDEEVVVKNLAKAGKDFSSVNGICWRDKNGEIKKNQPHQITNNLDDLGFPAHDLVQKDAYYDFMSKQKPLALIMAQRGCINRCTFCSCPALYRYRQRSVGHVIEELKWIKKLGYREFKFISAGISYDLNWINELLDQMISNNLNLSWWSNARADKLSRELLKKMEQAGCHTLAIGMESSDPTVLKNVGKNITAEQVKKAVFLIKEIGMEVVVYFIFGLPGETRESMENSIKFAKSLPADYVTMGVAQPLPKTKFYEYLDQNGYILEREWTKYDPVAQPVYQYPNLSRQEILEATRRGYRQFYLRPGYIIKKILAVRSPKDLKIGFINFIGLIKKYVL